MELPPEDHDALLSILGCADNPETIWEDTSKNFLSRAQSSAELSESSFFHLEASNPDRSMMSPEMQGPFSLSSAEEFDPEVKDHFVESESSKSASPEPSSLDSDVENSMPNSLENELAEDVDGELADEADDDDYDMADIIKWGQDCYKPRHTDLSWEEQLQFQYMGLRYMDRAKIISEHYKKQVKENCSPEVYQSYLHNANIEVMVATKGEVVFGESFDDIKEFNPHKVKGSFVPNRDSMSVFQPLLHFKKDPPVLQRFGDDPEAPIIVDIFLKPKRSEKTKNRTVSAKDKKLLSQKERNRIFCERRFRGLYSRGMNLASLRGPDDFQDYRDGTVYVNAYNVGRGKVPLETKLDQRRALFNEIWQKMDQAILGELMKYRKLPRYSGL